MSVEHWTHSEQYPTPGCTENSHYWQAPYTLKQNHPHLAINSVKFR